MVVLELMRNRYNYHKWKGFVESAKCSSHHLSDNSAITISHGFLTFDPLISYVFVELCKPP